MAKQRIKGAKTVKQNKTSKFNIYGEIVALFIVAFGLLMSVSFFFSAAGIFGKYLKEIFFGLFGYLAYIIPLFITSFGVHYMIKKGHLQHQYKYWLFLGLLVLIGAIIHIPFYNPNRDLTLGEKVKLFFHLGQQGKGGGFVGGVVAEPFISMFGIWGAGIILTTCVLVFIIIITEISIFRIIDLLIPIFKKHLSTLFKTMVAAAQKIKTNRTQIQEQDDLLDGTKSLSEEFDEDQLAGDLQAAAAEAPIRIYDHQTVRNNTVSGNFTESQTKVQEISEKKQKNKFSEMEEVNTSNEYINYTFPSIDLLNIDNQDSSKKSYISDLRNNAKKLVDTLKSFGVEAKVLQVSRGPSVTRYELQPSIGVKVSKIVNLADDIALNLAASGVRIEAPIPGKAAIGIEVPNKEVTPVFLREVIESDEFSQYPSKLAFALGKDIAGKPVVADIARMPHLLIAGATGSGKSVCINTLITSILYKSNPNDVKLVMIDPKVVELGVYNGIPHLLIPVVTDPKKAAGALNWAVQEMVNRYKLFADNSVRDLKAYNALLKEQGEENILPQIIIIIDELADLMMVAPNDVEDAICRLAQMARAAGMHLVIATQRPSVDVITGLIKANIPSRISFAVSSQVDSRTILDMGGAEKLLGKGDMLFYPVGAAKPQRLQGAFISDKEVESIVEYIKAHSGSNYHEDIIEQIEQEKEVEDVEAEDNDELLPQAIELVVEGGQASISMLQRRLKIGYARAARLIDQMEARGIVGGFEGSKPRQVLITRQQYHEMLMNSED
ncbi:MAG: segregation ATPase FtsK/SpoIIIE, family [Clostridiales bacterium]|jgi:S-DNA-T family DNA segregation ATPase FtsK/SpoIIIE|nr:segregation ATPase FtsK/SpoIIIE, family [Clostridiales bacterium]